MKNHESYKDPENHNTSTEELKEKYTLDRCRMMLANLLDDTQKDRNADDNNRLFNLYPQEYDTIDIFANFLATFNETSGEDAAQIGKPNYESLMKLTTPDEWPIVGYQLATVIEYCCDNIQYSNTEPPVGPNGHIIRRHYYDISPSREDPFFRGLRNSLATETYSIDGALKDWIKWQTRDKSAEVRRYLYDNDLLYYSILLIWEMDSSLKDGYFDDIYAMDYFNPNTIYVQLLNGHRKTGRTILGLSINARERKREEEKERKEEEEEKREKQKLRREHLDDIVTLYCGPLLDRILTNNNRLNGAKMDEVNEIVTKIILSDNKNKDKVTVAECLYTLLVSAKSFTAMQKALNTPQSEKNPFYRELKQLYSRSGIKF